jgi:hypothetical protein
MRSFARPDVTSKWTFPTTAFERLRCEVFADLTDRGFYVTNAAKFGGHFLVYSGAFLSFSLSLSPTFQCIPHVDTAGDPLCFHAEYIVLLSLPDAPLPIHDLVSLARLGVSVKKSAVIASFNSSGRVTYFTFEWQGITCTLRTIASLSLSLCRFSLSLSLPCPPQTGLNRLAGLLSFCAAGQTPFLLSMLLRPLLAFFDHSLRVIDHIWNILRSNPDSPTL